MRKNGIPKRMLSLLLTAVLCAGLVPAASAAAPVNGYNGPDGNYWTTAVHFHGPTDSRGHQSLGLQVRKDSEVDYTNPVFLYDHVKDGRYKWNKSAFVEGGMTLSGTVGEFDQLRVAPDISTAANSPSSISAGKGYVPLFAYVTAEEQAKLISYGSDQDGWMRQFKTWANQLVLKHSYDADSGEATGLLPSFYDEVEDPSWPASRLRPELIYSGHVDSDLMDFRPQPPVWYPKSMSLLCELVPFEPEAQLILKLDAPSVLNPGANYSYDPGQYVINAQITNTASYPVYVDVRSEMAWVGENIDGAVGGMTPHEENPYGIQYIPGGSTIALSFRYQPRMTFHGEEIPIFDEERSFKTTITVENITARLGGFTSEAYGAKASTQVTCPAMDLPEFNGRVPELYGYTPTVVKSGRFLNAPGPTITVTGANLDLIDCAVLRGEYVRPGTRDGVKTFIRSESNYAYYIPRSRFLSANSSSITFEVPAIFSDFESAAYAKSLPEGQQKFTVELGWDTMSQVTEKDKEKGYWASGEVFPGWNPYLKFETASSPYVGSTSSKDQSMSTERSDWLFIRYEDPRISMGDGVQMTSSTLGASTVYTEENNQYAPISIRGSVERVTDGETSDTVETYRVYPGAVINDVLRLEPANDALSDSKEAYMQVSVNKGKWTGGDRVTKVQITSQNCSLWQGDNRLMYDFQINLVKDEYYSKYFYTGNEGMPRLPDGKQWQKIEIKPLDGNEFMRASLDAGPISGLVTHIYLYRWLVGAGMKVSYFDMLPPVIAQGADYVGNLEMTFDEVRLPMDNALSLQAKGVAEDIHLGGNFLFFDAGATLDFSIDTLSETPDNEKHMYFAGKMNITDILTAEAQLNCDYYQGYYVVDSIYINGGSELIILIPPVPVIKLYEIGGGIYGLKNTISHEGWNYLPPVNLKLEASVADTMGILDAYRSGVTIGPSQFSLYNTQLSVLGVPLFHNNYIAAYATEDGTGVNIGDITLNFPNYHAEVRGNVDVGGVGILTGTGYLMLAVRPNDILAPLGNSGSTREAIEEWKRNKGSSLELFNLMGTSLLDAIAKAVDVSGGASGSAQVPDGIPVIGGYQIAGAEASFAWKDPRFTVYIAGYIAEENGIQGSFEYTYERPANSRMALMSTDGADGLEPTSCVLENAELIPVTITPAARPSGEETVPEKEEAPAPVEEEAPDAHMGEDAPAGDETALPQALAVDPPHEDTPVTLAATDTISFTVPDGTATLAVSLITSQELGDGETVKFTCGGDEIFIGKENLLAELDGSAEYRYTVWVSENIRPGDTWMAVVDSGLVTKCEAANWKAVPGIKELTFDWDNATLTFEGLDAETAYTYQLSLVPAEDFKSADPEKAGAEKNVPTSQGYLLKEGPVTDWSSMTVSVSENPEDTEAEILAALALAPSGEYRLTATLLGPDGDGGTRTLDRIAAPESSVSEYGNPNAPSKIENLSAADAGNGAIALSWTAPADNKTQGYLLSIKDKNGNDIEVQNYVVTTEQETESGKPYAEMDYPLGEGSAVKVDNGTATLILQPGVGLKADTEYQVLVTPYNLVGAGETQAERTRLIGFTASTAVQFKASDPATVTVGSTDFQLVPQEEDKSNQTFVAKEKIDYSESEVTEDPDPAKNGTLITATPATGTVTLTSDQTLRSAKITLVGVEDKPKVLNTSEGTLGNLAGGVPISLPLERGRSYAVHVETVNENGDSGSQHFYFSVDGTGPMFYVNEDASWFDGTTLHVEGYAEPGLTFYVGESTGVSPVYHADTNRFVYEAVVSDYNKESVTQTYPKWEGDSIKEGETVTWTGTAVTFGAQDALGQKVYQQFLSFESLDGEAAAPAYLSVSLPDAASRLTVGQSDVPVTVQLIRKPAYDKVPLDTGDYTLTSSDSSVLSVSGGKVTAVAAGKAVLTVSYTKDEATVTAKLPIEVAGPTTYTGIQVGGVTHDSVSLSFPGLEGASKVTVTVTPVTFRPASQMPGEDGDPSDLGDAVTEDTENKKTVASADKISAQITGLDPEHSYKITLEIEGGSYAGTSAPLYLSTMREIPEGKGRGVTYHADGATSGNVPADPNVYLKGDTVVVSGNTDALVRGGDALAGWSTQPNGGGDRYMLSDTETPTFTMPDRDVDLYAVWGSGGGTPPSGGGGSSSSKGPEMGGVKGWDALTGLIAKAEAGTTLTIDMNGEKELPGGVLDAIAGRDVTLVLDMGDGLSWTIRGADVPKKSGGWAEWNMGITQGVSAIPASVRELDGSLSQVQIRLDHDGPFDFALTLTAELGQKNAGYWANLYYYDGAAKALEFCASARIDGAGAAALPFRHASDYLIVVSEQSLAPDRPWDDPFTDVRETDWYYGAVKYVYQKGLMNGTGADVFTPGGSASRAMVAAILYRLEGSPSSAGEGSAFPDVPDGQWYTDAVAWCAQTELMTGYGGGLFGPGDPVTREQLVTVLHRYAAYRGLDVSVGEDTNILSYTDALDVAEWAVPGFQWACGADIVGGKPDERLDPQGTATRAELAAVLERFAAAAK